MGKTSNLKITKSAKTTSKTKRSSCSLVVFGYKKRYDGFSTAKDFLLLPLGALAKRPLRLTTKR